MPFDLRGSIGELEIPGGAAELAGPLTAKGVATSIGDGVYVEANVRGSVRLTCSRCLSPFQKALDLSCEAKFVEKSDAAPAAEEEEVEVFALHGKLCDLDEMVRHEIVLCLPMKPLCSERCKGLCPVCGKNLNEGDCGCPKPDEPPSAFGRKLQEAVVERSRKDGRT